MIKSKICTIKKLNPSLGFYRNEILFIGQLNNYIIFFDDFKSIFLNKIFKIHLI